MITSALRKAISLDPHPGHDSRLCGEIAEVHFLGSVIRVRVDRPEDMLCGVVMITARIEASATYHGEVDLEFVRGSAGGERAEFRRCTDGEWRTTLGRYL